jgi:uncharacterized protein
MAEPLDVPSLHGDRVVLRPWLREDAPAIARIAADPEVPRWTYLPVGMTVEQAQDWIAGFEEAAGAGEAIALAIVDDTTDEVVGNVGFGAVDRRRGTAEAFWWLDVNARRRGLATAALRLASDWAFDDLGLARVTARAEPANAASLALAARLGFRVEGRMRSAEPAKDGDGRIDLLLLALLAEERPRTGAGAARTAGTAGGTDSTAGGPAGSAMEQRVSLVTLGVADLDRAVRFYEALGWRGQQTQGTAFFQAGGLVVALWSRAELAADAGVEDPGGFGGLALAHNVRSPGEVDALLAAAEAAGAAITRPAGRTPWGGYTGCFTDPDGHVWEVAHNPGFPLTADGAVVLPDLGG